jgi:uroporphyrinogen decarboxylase
MTSRERLLAALAHIEPDRVPLDLGSTQVTGIHAVAYRNLREALGLPPVAVQLSDAIQRLALPDDDLVQALAIDTRGLFPLNSHNWHVREEDAGDVWAYHDEWGITHHRPKPVGLYFSVVQVPLAGRLTMEAIEKHPWPDMGDPRRIAGLRAQAEQYRAAGYGVVLKDPFAGLFEMAQRIAGMEDLLVLMATERAVAVALFARLLDLKLAFWEMALPQLADLVDVITQADDYGTQTSQLISPRMFRQQLKPLLRESFACVQRLAPRAKRFFHSCGNVRPLIPDLIEIGVEILNPVHIRASGMEPTALKREFGRELVFWGGGVDTQGVLPQGTPQEVQEEVQRNLEALAPGGGYVFTPVHNIQADVPVENIVAMWQALQRYGVYPCGGSGRPQQET